MEEASSPQMAVLGLIVLGVKMSKYSLISINNICYSLSDSSLATAFSTFL